MDLLDEIIEMERNGCAHQDWDDTKNLINIYGIAAGMARLHSKNIVQDECCQIGIQRNYIH